MATKEEYEKALKEMNDAFYGSTFLNSETRRFDDNLNLLRELVNEHFEEKKEKNLEHYKYEIIKMFVNQLGIVNGKIGKCIKTPCNECGFLGEDGKCIGRNGINKWLEQPYRKQPYKLNHFEYDLLNAYKDSGMRKPVSYYSAMHELHEKGYFEDIDTSMPIHEILSSCEVVNDENS